MAQRLKSVTISGYKSISSQNPLTVNTGDITVLLGANGSGKSNIISFFKMLNFMMSGSFQRFIEQAGTSQFFLNYGPKHTLAIVGKLCFENLGAFTDYTFRLEPAVSDKLMIAEEEIAWWRTQHDRQTFTVRADFNFGESALIGNNTAAVKTVFLTLSNCRVFQFHDSSAKSYLRLPSRIGGANYLQSEGGNLASFLYLLKNDYPDNYRRIVSYVQQVMPQFRDFYLEPNSRGYVGLNWRDTSPNDYVLFPEQFSDGTIRFIALATLLLQPEMTMPSVIIIDEPELGLHPFAIAQLAEMIKEAAVHTQVIIATQSPGLVDEFEAEQITVIERDEESDSTLARRLDAEDLAEWLENYSLGELWNKNVLGGRP